MLLAVGAMMTTSLATIQTYAQPSGDVTTVIIDWNDKSLTVKGATGATGATGPAGPTGPAGANSTVPGPAGPPGPQGPPGTNASVTFSCLDANNQVIACPFTTPPVPEPEPPVTNDTGNGTVPIPEPETPVENQTGNDTGPVDDNTTEPIPEPLPPIDNQTTGNGTDVNGTTTEPLCADNEFLNLTSGQCELSALTPDPEEPNENGTIPEEDGFEPE